MSRIKKKASPMGLNITSLMDVMTIVLVFLLNLLAAEGSLMTSASNLVLPVSAQSRSPQEVSLTIVGDEEWIMVDDQQIVKTEDVRKQDSLNVQPVLEILLEKRENEIRAELMGVTEESTGKVVVQFDKNMDYDVVTKVMATCGYAGYNNIKFAVIRKGEEGV